jgi:hypothetical protein
MSEPAALIVPPIRSAIVDVQNAQNGPTTSRTWYLFFLQARDSLADLLANAIRGAQGLLQENVVPKVGPNPGELVGSSISDDGELVEVNGLVDVRPPVGSGFEGITIRHRGNGADESTLTVLHKVDGYGWRARARDGDGGFTLDVQSASVWHADAITVDSSTGFVGIETLIPGWALDVTGDINTSAVYRVAGTQVVGARAAGLTASGLALAAPPAAYNPAYETTVQTLVNNLKTRVDELELRLKAHGLIA